MALVGEVVDVGLAEFESPRRGRKHRTKTLAVPAGVADLQLPADF